MSKFVSMVVDVKTADVDDANTGDPIYVGVYGSSGGREFALMNENKDQDFGRGKNVLYEFGLAGYYDVTLPIDDIRPKTRAYRSDQNENNDPGLLDIDVGQVQNVYVRKQGNRSDDDDNGWLFSFITVYLFGVNFDVRPFNHRGQGFWLANENGNQLWLRGPRNTRNTSEFASFLKRQTLLKI